MTALLLFQLRRVGRNRQYLFFTVLLPALFTVFFTKVFGGQPQPARLPGRRRRYMVSMMAYGAIGAALGATIRLSFDRASGWLRQLRVHAGAASARSLAVDVLVGALLALPSLVVVALVGRFVNGVELAAGHLAAAGRRCCGPGRWRSWPSAWPSGWRWTRRRPAAAIGIVGAILAALGGLWFPVEVFPAGMRPLAHAHAVLLVRRAGPGRRRRRAPRRRRCWRWPASGWSSPPLAVVVARRRPLYAVAG